MEIILDPIVSRRLFPIIRVPMKVIAGNVSLNIKAGWNLYVPNVWSIQGLQFQYVADASVGNRYHKVSLYSEDGQLYDQIYSGAIAASETKKYSVHKEFGFSTMNRWGADGIVSLHNDSFIFSGNEYLNFATTAGVAGDTVSIWLSLKWRNWDLGMQSPRTAKVNK